MASILASALAMALEKLLFGSRAGISLEVRNLMHRSLLPSDLSSGLTNN
jgi:hypothetical protein